MDISQEDIDRNARMQEEKIEKEELSLALSLSQSTTEAEARRRASERRLREEYDETRLALSASRVVDEQITLRRVAAAEAEARDLEAARRQEEEDMTAAARMESYREAAARRWEEEQLARALAESQAEAEEEAFRRAVAASQIAADREQKEMEQELAREMATQRASALEEQQRLLRATAARKLQETHCVYGLSEEEQLHLALVQSQEGEDATQAAATERMRKEMLRTRKGINPDRRHVRFEPTRQQSGTPPVSRRPVLGAMASYPPGPITEQETKSVAENPNALHELLTPGSSAPPTPCSNVSQAVDSGVGLDAYTEAGSALTQARTKKNTSGIGGFRNIATNALSRVNRHLPRTPGAFPSPAPSVASAIPSSDRTMEEGPIRCPGARHHDDVLASYPGAYPPTPSRASVTSRRSVSSQGSSVCTPVPIGAYPPSYRSMGTPRSVVVSEMGSNLTFGAPGAFPTAHSEATSTPRKDVGNNCIRIDTPEAMGAYPPSSRGAQTLPIALSRNAATYEFTPSPLQADVVSQGEVGGANTPTAVDAYPPSCGGSELCRIIPDSSMTSNFSAVHGRSVSHNTPRPIGAHTSSFLEEDMTPCARTVSSGAIAITAPENHSSRTATSLQGPVVEFHQPVETCNDYTGHEGRTPSFPISSKGILPPSSKTPYGSVASKSSSRSITPAATHTPVLDPSLITPTSAPVPAQLSTVSPQSSHCGPIQYHFNGPVTVNNYNVRAGGREQKISMLKQVLSKGARLVEHNDGAGIDFRSVTEAANAIKNHTASWLETGAARIRKTQSHTPTFIERHVNTTPAPVSEVAEVVEIQEAVLCDTLNGAGSTYTLNQIKGQLYCMNPDPSRTTLATPANGASSVPVLPLPQAAPVVPRPFTPVNPMIGSLSRRQMSVQRRPVPGTPARESMVSDPNVNAVTPPIDRQSDPTVSGDGSNTPDLLYDSPPSPPTVVRRPPPLPRKPAHLVNPFGSPLPRPAVPYSLPTFGHTRTQSQPQLQQPQQFRFPSQAQQPQEPTQFPIMYPTAGSHPNMSDSPSSLGGSAPTPERVTAALGRSHGHVRWNSDLANVPPPERTIDDYHSRSINDLSRYNGVGDPHVMAPLQRQHETMYTRGGNGECEDEAGLKDTPLAKRKEKDQQKYLRGQLSGGRM